LVAMRRRDQWNIFFVRRNKNPVGRNMTQVSDLLYIPIRDWTGRYTWRPP
jgi:hypothetical protein